MALIPASSRLQLDGVRCAFYFIVFYATLGVLIPFWPVWLSARGLDPGQIALIGAVMTGARIVTTPLIGAFSDRVGRRTTLLSGLAVAALLAFSAMGWTESFAGIFILTILFAIPWTAMGPLGENSAALALRRRGLDYARIRLWGSLAFIGGTLGMARWLENHSDDGVHTVLGLGFALVALGCMLLPPIGPRPEREAGDAGSFRRLLALPGLPTLFLAAGAIQASHGFYYTFGTLNWRAAGMSDWLIGWLWATGVVAEIALFAFAGPRLRRVDDRTLLLIAGAGAVVRWSLTAFVDWPPFLFAIQVLHGLSFGLCHLTIMHYMVNRVPIGLAATGQTLNAALSGGVLMGVATLVSGPLYSAHGGGGYWAMAGLAGLGLLGALKLRESASR